MPTWLVALNLGLLSALSLPLGAIVARFWTPRARVNSFLLAFGGGALLAALTIDLVDSALDRGHFGPLSGGCVVGGLLFAFLNDLVNRRGGFLRKASTTLSYLRQRGRARLRNNLTHLGRVDFFQGLPDEDLDELADNLSTLELEPGATIYRYGDPCEHINLVEEGEVELAFPEAMEMPARRVGARKAFGQYAFLVGPHNATAIATERTRLRRLARGVFDRVLARNEAMRARIVAYVRSPKFLRFLQEAKGLGPQAAAMQAAQLEECVVRGTTLLPASDEARRRGDGFKDFADEVHRFPLFHELPKLELEQVCSKMFRKRHEKGHTFFVRDEPADRLYVIEQGEVSLHEARDGSRESIELDDHHAFGGMSFLTGAPHTATAVATADTSVWVLRKGDLRAILPDCPTLRRRLQEFLAQGGVDDYLQERQQLYRGRAADWVKSAVREMEVGRLLPVADLQRTMSQHAGAPLAIWLGILLDGIPESAVIGVGVVASGTASYSLLAGLFISNFPEALSSSVGMREQGMSSTRVFWMWASLMIITGVGAALGAALLGPAPIGWVSFVEGIAAGAMLTMIAETMLPEAYAKGGPITGLSTLFGFLVAIFFSTLH